MIFHEVFNKTGGISTTDNGGSVLLLTNHFGDNGGSSGIGWVFGLAEAAVPNDGICIDDVICNFGGGERADIELVAVGVFVEIFGDVDFVVG